LKYLKKNCLNKQNIALKVEKLLCQWRDTDQSESSIFRGRGNGSILVWYMCHPVT